MNDIEELKSKKIDVENAVCDLYKQANSVLHSGLFADEKELAIVHGIKKLCIKWLMDVAY